MGPFPFCMFQMNCILQISHLSDLMSRLHSHFCSGEVIFTDWLDEELLEFYFLVLEGRRSFDYCDP